MLMTLAPGEEFEHRHASDSTTILVQGSVDLVMDGARAPLVIGSPRRIPAKVSHVLINTGDAPAVVECVHRDEPTP